MVSYFPSRLPEASSHSSNKPWLCDVISGHQLHTVTTTARENRSVRSSKHQGAETEEEGQKGFYLSLLQSHVLHRAMEVACNPFGEEIFLPETKEASDNQWKYKPDVKLRNSHLSPRCLLHGRGGFENCSLPLLLVRQGGLHYYPPTSLPNKGQQRERALRNWTSQSNTRILSKLVFALNISRCIYCPNQFIHFPPHPWY